MFSVDYDATLGIVRCQSEGFFTIEEASQFVSLGRVAAERSLRLHGHIKMLVVSDGQVQSAEVIECSRPVQEFYAQLPRTRIAMVLPSILLKLQVARVLTAPAFRTFVSESAALTWLCAESDGDGREAMFAAAR